MYCLQRALRSLSVHSPGFWVAMCRRHLNDQLAVQTTSLALPRCAPITGLARSGLARPWRAMLDFHSQFLPNEMCLSSPSAGHQGEWCRAPMVAQLACTLDLAAHSTTTRGPHHGQSVMWAPAHRSMALAQGDPEHTSPHIRHMPHRLAARGNSSSIHTGFPGPTP